MNEPSFFSEKAQAIYESGNGELVNPAPSEAELENTIAAAADVASSVGPNSCLWDSSIWNAHAEVHDAELSPLNLRSAVNHTCRKHSAYNPPNSSLLQPFASRVSKLSTGSAGIPNSANAIAQQRKPRRYSAACVVQRNLSCFDLKDVSIAELTRSLVVTHESFPTNENDGPNHSTRPPHLPHLQSERDQVELWLDAHPEFLYDYILRKVPRRYFEQWLQLHSRSNSRADGSCRHSVALDGGTVPSDATAATVPSSRRSTTHRSPAEFPLTSNGSISSNSRTASGMNTPARKSSKNGSAPMDVDPNAPVVKQLVTSDAAGFPAGGTRFAESDARDSSNYSSGNLNAEASESEASSSTSTSSSIPLPLPIPLLIAPAHDNAGNELQMQVIEEQSTASPSSSSLSGLPTTQEGSSTSAAPLLEPQGLLYELVLDICNDLDASRLYDKILHNLCLLLSAERCVLFLVQRSDLTGERVLVARTRPHSDPPSGSGSGQSQSPCSPEGAQPIGDAVGNSDSDCSTLSERASPGAPDPPPLPPPSSLATLVEVPIDAGILGRVASNGCTVNLSDVPQDPRFDPAVDELEPDVWLYLPVANSNLNPNAPTPATPPPPAERAPVRSLLCTPIKNGFGQVVGVCELVNKRLNGGIVTAFGAEDERLLAAYSIFCGLCIHHTKMYERAMRAIAKQRVALEVLSYHAVAPIEEALRLRRMRIPSARYYQLSELSFNDLALTDEETLRACLRMLLDLGALDVLAPPPGCLCSASSCSASASASGAGASDALRLREREREKERAMSAEPHYDLLCRWLLSVKKNYRNVTYHNWRHAFAVAQMMFAMHSAPDVAALFEPLERLALLIACLCHDLDHRGTNNQFQVRSGSPLAQLYSTSVLEHHHFDQCCMLLNTKGAQILQRLPHEQYARMMRLLEQCIIATDLAVYFRLRSRFFALFAPPACRPDWTRDEHRALLRCMMMTACDLGAITKPWDVQKRVAELVFCEYFEQGDIERNELHVEPADMMNREKKAQLPAMQVAFIDSICHPVYQHLVKASPSFQPLLSGVLSNRSNWQALADAFANSQQQQQQQQQNQSQSPSPSQQRSSTEAQQAASVSVGSSS